MYEDLDKNWFMRQYVPDYEEIEEAWERYKDIIACIDTVDNLPEDLSSLDDYLLMEVSSMIIDIIGRAVFGDEQYDQVIDFITDEFYDTDWSGCSFERGNAIYVDIQAFIDFIKDIAEEHNITLEEQEYREAEITCQLNSETDFKFV